MRLLPSCHVCRRDIKLDVYEFEERGDEVETKWRFSCILDLPWRPRLAAAGGPRPPCIPSTHPMRMQAAWPWPVHACLCCHSVCCPIAAPASRGWVGVHARAPAGGTTHVISNGRVVRHIERWDVEPGKVVSSLFVPAAKVPSNPWEAFFMAASNGDASGMWFVLTPNVIKLSLPIIGVSLATKLVTGEGLPGVFLGTVEGLAYLGFVSACVTEVVKFAGGMQGGETGTGGRF